MEKPASDALSSFTNVSTSLPGLASSDLSGFEWSQIYMGGVSVVATAANVCVIVCLWRDPRSEVSGFSTYTVSMALTDLLVGVVLMPIKLVESMRRLGLAVCLLSRHIDFGLTSVSMFLFLAMGYDRYRSVTAPLQYRSQFRKSRARGISVFVWTAGFVIWTPYLLLKMFKHKIDCVLFNFGPNLLEVIQYILAYYIPFVALITMNSILIWTLNTRIPRSQPPAGSGGKGIANIATVSGMIKHHSRSREPVTSVSVMNENRLHKAKKKRSRMISSYKVVLLVVFFSVCWLPYCIAWPANGLCPKCISENITDILGYFVYAQSAINPLMVIVTTPRIRSSLLRTCAVGLRRQ